MTKCNSLFQAASVNLLHRDGIVRYSCADDREMDGKQMQKLLVLNAAQVSGFRAPNH